MRALVVTVVHDPQDARIRHRQIDALVRAGHEVVFAAPFTAYGRSCPADLECVDLPRATGRQRLAALRAARRVIREHAASVDLVLVHDPELLLATRGVPGVVWDVHEDTAAALSMKAWLPRPFRPAGRALIRALERAAERGNRLILAEDSYGLRFRRPHPVVPNSALTPAAEVEPPGDDRVVYLGRITTARGAREMVELGRRLAPGIRVELTGKADADCRPAVERAHAAGHLHWNGFVPNAEALQGLRGALAGLSLLHDQPNYAHSRPTKIMEYMALGVPVVTTPNPSSVELVEEHDCGIVVPFDDVDAAVAALRRLRDDIELRARLAHNGRTAAVDSYSWAADAPRFVALLEKWAGSTPTEPAAS